MINPNQLEEKLDQIIALLEEIIKLLEGR